MPARKYLKKIRWLAAGVLLGVVALFVCILGAGHFLVAPKVLLTGLEGGHSKTRNAYLNWRARYLIDEGVPESAVLFDRRSASSWEEAVNTLRLMQSMKLERVLVVSDPPHMRRLLWVWARVFAGSGKAYTLVASDMEGWDATDWWRTSRNAQSVFGELIKLGYYLVQY